MEHPVLAAIARAAFTPLGWFAPQVADNAPPEARVIILIGNAGPAMFRRFAAERLDEPDPLDRWTRRVVDALAVGLGAQALYPFGPVVHPFQRWARRAGAGHASPLGLNIHPRYGLWHAYRAALAFPAAVDLPPPPTSAHPCETCAAKPCLSACPVNAFGNGYETQVCAAHLRAPEGAACMTGGCLARRACPVGADHVYDGPQAVFHMDAFLAARAR